MKPLFSSILLITANVFCYSVSSAQIVYTDIIPDATVSTTGTTVVYPVMITHDTALNKDIQFRIVAYANEIKATCINCQLLADAGGFLPQALNNNNAINSTSSVWMSPDTTFAAGLWDGTTGNWNNVTDKYIGFRFMKNSQWRYGWLRLNVTEVSTVFSATLKDYAYNATPGNEIKTGQTTTLVKNPILSNIKVYSTNSTICISGVRQPVAVLITDMQGKKVLSKNITEDILLNNLQAGVYIIKLLAENACSTYKIAVEN